MGFVTVRNVDLCPECAQVQANEIKTSVMVTTTPRFDGFRVTRYIGVESVEVVMGTGLFSEFAGDIADFFGSRSTAFEKKLQEAKEAAINRLKYIAYTHQFPANGKWKELTMAESRSQSGFHWWAVQGSNL